MKAAKLDFVLNVYARAILATLSSEDITRAIAFYASKEGQGFLKHSIAQELRPPEAAATELTPAEQALNTRPARIFLPTEVLKNFVSADCRVENVDRAKADVADHEVPGSIAVIRSDPEDGVHRGGVPDISSGSLSM